MNVSIVYFSGTGNTKTIAEGYGTALYKQGHCIDIQSIETTTSIPPHDLLIIGGPIYAGNMPDNLINWVRKNVKRVYGQKSIVFSTSAGLENAHGIKSIGKKLEKKGYLLTDTTAFKMPRNFYLDRYAPTPESDQKQEFEDAATKIIESISRLDDCSFINIKESVLLTDLSSDLFRLIAIFLGKSFRITDKCVQCGLCEKNCPKNNINPELFMTVHETLPKTA
ncbi:EFR1 family ferrodoxin [Fusibacter sp. JL298sf-3]